jgi:hypothetical protein
MSNRFLFRRGFSWAVVIVSVGATFGCAMSSDQAAGRGPVSEIGRDSGGRSSGDARADLPKPKPDPGPLTHAVPPVPQPPPAWTTAEKREGKKKDKKAEKKGEKKDESWTRSKASPPPPPPPPPVPAVATVTATSLHPETVSLVRYPAIDSPEVMRPGRRDPVTVSLEEEQTTPTKVLDAHGQPSAGGDAVIELPAPYDVPEEEAWKLTVKLEMPDGDVDRPIQEILLRRTGPADVATFKVKPTWTPTVPQERRTQALLATFTRQGVLIARAIRMVTVTADPDFKPPDRPAALIAQGGGFGGDADRADLYIESISLGRMEKSDATPDEPSDRFLFQAMLAGQDQLPVGAGGEVVMKGLDAFLAQRYRKLATLGRRSGDADPDEARRTSNTDEVRQFGADLWTHYTPEVVKSRIRLLQAAKARGADIRFQTNDPRFPLELLLVPVDGVGDCALGEPCELLGVLHRVSRWHSDNTLGIHPGIRTRVGAVAMVAPHYANPLPAVAREREAMQRLAGDRFTSVAGTFATFVASLEAPPFPAVLHYAGHGSARPDVLPGLQQYALRLEDQEVSLATFEQHAAWTTGSGARGPLLFLNACQVGQASGAYGWVEGWGPAALERGAAGFIGGLWELGDAGAEGFAEKFYTRVLAGMPVAEAMRQVRSEYAASADPTYAAYVYYGHPELRLAPPP